MNSRDDSLTPWGNDPLFRFLALRLARRSAVTAAFLYFLPSYLLMHLLGMLTGHFWGRDGLPPMYATFESNVNLGIFVPVGVGLLCNFYFAVEGQFARLIRNGAVPSESLGEFRDVLRAYEKRLNSSTAVWVCVVLALGLDATTFFAKRGSWHCVDGGLVGVYAALFKGINFYYIFLVGWKCLLTLIVLRRVDDFGLRIHPLHPDGVGGLAPAGRVALAVNWFLALLMAYLTFVYFFDPFFSASMSYIVITLACYPLALVAIYMSLEGIHRAMEQARGELLARLAGETEDWLAGRGPAPDAVLALYPLVQAMPVWPFRPGSFARFFTTITLPFLVFVIQLVVNRDSILWDPAVRQNIEQTLNLILGP